MYLPYVGKKYTKLLSMKDEMHFEIYWDGACGADKIREYSVKGVRASYWAPRFCLVRGLDMERHCIISVI